MPPVDAGASRAKAPANEEMCIGCGLMLGMSWPDVPGPNNRQTSWISRADESSRHGINTQWVSAGGRRGG